MKKLIKRLALLGIFYFLATSSAFALAMKPAEVLQMNSMARFLDSKPEGQGLRRLQTAIKDENPVLRGLAALVLYKHFGKRFQSLLWRNFTMNPDVDLFAQEKPVLVKLEDVNKLMESFVSAMDQIKDPRLQRLFMFFHMRHKNVWLIGASGERLSMAIFYRIGTFDLILGEKFDPIRLAALADKKN